MNRHLTLFFLAFILLSACSNTSNTNTTNTSEPPVVKRVSAEEFKTQLEALGDNVNLVDVRTPEEFAQGAIDGAININFRDSNFEAQMDKLDKEKPIMVYCQAGGRSGKATKKLEKLGFKTIYDLSVGYGGWPK